MTLPAQWQAFSDSVQPDAAVARRRLDQTVDLARKYTSLTEKQLSDLASYADVIGNDPVLKDLLPENSNLRQFQNSGFLLPSPPEGIGELWRVFGIRGVRDGVTSVEWKTSLQKTLGRYIADGGVIRGGRFLYLFLGSHQQQGVRT